MSEKKFPISQEKLEEIIAKYPTPFHIYDEKATQYVNESINKIKQEIIIKRRNNNF